MSHRSLRAALAVAVIVAASVIVGGASAGSAATPQVDPPPIFKAFPNLSGYRASFPTWSVSYTDPTDHVTYPITLIGSDPRTPRDASVRTVIIPLKMNFVAAGQDTSILNNLGYTGFTAPPLNHTFDASRRVQDVLQSPIYSSYTYPIDMGGDTAQYGDAFMRAQFGRISTGRSGRQYHVRLDNVYTTPTQTVDVPADSGIAYQRPVGAWRTAHGMPTDTIAGIADFGWFANYIIDLMTTKLNLGSDVMPIFLTDNVMLYDGQYTACCTIGFHGTPAAAATTANAKLAAAQQTLMFSAWTTPGTYSGFLTDYTGERSAPNPARGLSDIHAFSHEVAEAFDDPFVNNAVTPWLTPTAPQYGCTPVLETGDPVVGTWFPLDGNNVGTKDGYNYYGQYHPEDNVFAQWYAHGALEALGLKSWDGRLTFMGPRLTSIPGFGGFADYSQGCGP
jgi:hypothetical protein